MEEFKKMNNYMAVGRISKMPTTINENGKEKTILTIAVNRSYKNEKGIYPVDIIPITLWKGIDENSLEYLKTGDTIGIKGRIENNDEKLEIIAERMTFLSSSRKDNEE